MKWHRRFGVAAGLFAILFAVSGIVLNHAERLGADRTTIDWAPLLRLYGLEPEQPPVGLALDGERWVGWVDGGLYLGGHRIADGVGPPVGAVAAGDLIAVADRDTLLLFLGDGRLVERVGRELLPGPVDRLGRGAGDRLAVASGERCFAAPAATLGWGRCQEAPDWRGPVALPPDRHDALLAAYRGSGLPLDRVILDLHTGRLFGGIGVVIADLMAIAIVLLGVTGLWMWFRTRR